MLFEPLQMGSPVEGWLQADCAAVAFGLIQLCQIASQDRQGPAIQNQVMIRDENGPLI